MANSIRVGIQIIPSDAYWVQVGAAIEQQARHLGVELIAIDIDYAEPPDADYPGIFEELLAQEIEALIIVQIPETLINFIMEHGIPVISLAEQPGCNEQSCNHPRLVAPLGLYGVAQLLSEYIIERLPDHAQVLAVGGLAAVGEDGRNRIAGIYDAFAPYKQVQVRHISTSWYYDRMVPQILAGMQQLRAPLDAIFGLSDTIALVSRSAAEQLGLLTPQTMVVGINGDPQALAAIAAGTMLATVETSAFDFGTHVVELALRAASRQPLPAHFSYQPRLITPKNVAEVAAQKLVAIAELPNRLIGVNRHREQQHVTQLETSLAINRQIGTILDRHELTRTIINLIRTNYHYDRVLLYLWSETDQALVLDAPDACGVLPQKVALDDGGVLVQVLKSGELIYISDMRASQRFLPDRRWPKLRSRVVLPVRLGETVLGVLDLQCDYVSHHSREQRMGLQLLAEQLAITMRNAELYTEALTARKVAEKADSLKTRLLANVSHELRTPLNIILGYTKAALNVPNPYGIDLPAELNSDLNRIYRSGEHLIRLINDLLDLSRAEIDELEIFPEIIEVQPFVQEVFQSIANISNDLEPVKWQFVAPPRLPMLQADPLRLRQILLNLLSNARKFTSQGQITLGVEVQLPYIHIWIEDSGSGIPADQQANIFEPFVMGENASQRPGGVGLGLSITRRLVALHRGVITVESTPGKGSTFHVYLPLPNLSGQLIAPPATTQNQLVVVCITNRRELPAEMEALGRQDNITLYQLPPCEVNQDLLNLHPSIISWDIANTTEKDWLAMNYLRSTPELAQLPLMLYANFASEINQSGLTNILLKPFSGQTLQALLEALRPANSEGGVLIVDDDVEMLDMYQQLIQSALPGLPIHRVASGQAALALLKELVPNLVIIDLVMPEIDGFEVIEWLRTNPSTRNVPVLAISGMVLTSEKIQRLDFSRIALQTKEILSTEEASSSLQQVISGAPLLPHYNSMLVKRAVAYLQHNYTNSLSLQKIAEVIGVSKNYLVKNFHQEIGISPWEYLNRYRIKEARRLLGVTDLTITEIAAQVGFDDPAYFSRVFKVQTGQSPKEYRSQATL